MTCERVEAGRCRGMRVHVLLCAVGVIEGVIVGVIEVVSEQRGAFLVGMVAVLHGG